MNQGFQERPNQWKVHHNQGPLINMRPIPSVFEMQSAKNFLANR